MPIEFSCTQCGKQLRTPDETAGKQAKCPQCGAVMEIPRFSSLAPLATPAESPASPFGPAPQPDQQQGWNPYASPHIGGQSAGTSEAVGDILPSRVDFSHVIEVAWRIYKSQVGFGVLVALTVFGIGLLVMIPVMIVVGGMAAGGAFPLGPMPGGQPAQLGVQMFAVGLGIQIFTWLFQTWLDLGILRCFLNVARGTNPQIGDLFTGGRYWSRGLVVTGIITGVGILLSIPGVVTQNEMINGACSIVSFIVAIVLQLLFAQALPLIVDKNQSAGDALTNSMLVMRGNKLTAVLVVIVVAIVGGLFMVVTCLIGILFAIPFMHVLRAVFYLQATGQPTADRAPASY